MIPYTKRNWFDIHRRFAIVGVGSVLVYGFDRVDLLRQILREQPQP